jgi:hypothetical protein
VSPPVACERQYRSRGPGLETHDPQVAGLGSHSGHYSGLEARHGGRMASKGGFALVRDSRSIDTTEPIHSRPLLSCSMASSLMHIVSNFQLPGFLTSSRDSAENGRRTLVHVGHVWVLAWWVITSYPPTPVTTPTHVGDIPHV